MSPSFKEGRFAIARHGHGGRETAAFINEAIEVIAWRLGRRLQIAAP
jgi:hypothetical protein